MFQDILARLLRNVKGARWAMVVGLDGVLLDASGPGSTTRGEALAAEYALFHRACQRLLAETASGELQNLLMITDQSKIVCQSLTPEYFLLVSLDPEGHSGRARFEISRARALLEHELVY